MEAGDIQTCLAFTWYSRQLVLRSRWWSGEALEKLDSRSCPHCFFVTPTDLCPFSLALTSSSLASTSFQLPGMGHPAQVNFLSELFFSVQFGFIWELVSSNMISYLGTSSPVLCKFVSEMRGTAQLHPAASETHMQINAFREWWESHFSSHRAKPNKDCHWHTHRQSYACAVTVRENKRTDFHKLLVKKFHFVNIWNVQIKHKRTHHSNLSKMSTFYCLAWDFLCF